MDTKGKPLSTLGVLKSKETTSTENVPLVISNGPKESVDVRTGNLYLKFLRRKGQM